MESGVGGCWALKRRLAGGLRETVMRWQTWLTLSNLSSHKEGRAGCRLGGQGFWLEKHAFGLS